MKLSSYFSIIFGILILLGSFNLYSKNKPNLFIPPQGLVPNQEAAIKIAEIILSSVYGKDTIEKQKPLTAELKNEAWNVNGTLPGGFVGGTAFISISKHNGQVLMLFHTQ